MRLKHKCDTCALRKGCKTRKQISGRIEYCPHWVKIPKEKK